jgi:hypothetical protein
MDLKTLHIAGYKNLVDTRLTFDTGETPITIIGNNGTGKSNLIEALLHIFVGLYYDRPPDFDFHLQYEAHNKTIEISRSLESGSYEAIVDGWPLNNVLGSRNGRASPTGCRRSLPRCSPTTPAPATGWKTSSSDTTAATIWLPRSSVGATPDALASRHRHGTQERPDCIPTLERGNEAEAANA